LFHTTAERKGKGGGRKLKRRARTQVGEVIGLPHFDKKEKEEKKKKRRKGGEGRGCSRWSARSGRGGGEGKEEGGKFFLFLS